MKSFKIYSTTNKGKVQMSAKGEDWRSVHNRFRALMSKLNLKVLTVQIDTL